MIDYERLFIIGDIHGCLEMLQRLLEQIRWRPEHDGLIFLGDYIDRGEDPKGVIDYLLEIARGSSHVKCLMGNHEKMFLDYMSGEDLTTFLLNGGDTTLESYSSNGGLSIPVNHIEFIESLCPFIELESYYVVHAGLRPGIEMNAQSIDDFLWIRDDFIHSDYDFGKKVIFGHTPFYKPFIRKNKIGLDTGAVYGNKLTCLELPSFRFHDVGCREEGGS